MDPAEVLTISRVLERIPPYALAKSLSAKIKSTIDKPNL
jgi:hypothetical protein